MHIEILVEDSSAKTLLQLLLPEILGKHGQSHSWNIHSYKGVGRIPKNLVMKSDPSRRILLDQLPRLLRGYGNTPGIDAVVVVLDSDRRDCVSFLAELKSMAINSKSSTKVLFRLAIEETEAWYFGDQKALLKAYPKARKDILKKYVQDSVCDTWELLADAIHAGGAAAIKGAGWPLPGQVKHEWAMRIGPHMDVETNGSPSFCRLRDGLRQLYQMNINGE